MAIIKRRVLMSINVIMIQTQSIFFSDRIWIYGMLLAATTIFVTCQSNHKDITESVAIASAKFSDRVYRDSNEFYFPMEVFRDTSLYVGRDTFINSWYSEQLFAMREPILYLENGSNEIYRFTWLRTFHNPIAIRIEKNGHDYILFWKQCSGAGGYEPGNIEVSTQRVISKVQWDKFKSKVHTLNFWNMNTNEGETLGTDGSRWILEGKEANKYHVVDRWTPNEKSNFYRCCDFLIQLTDLNVNNKY